MITVCLLTSALAMIPNAVREPPYEGAKEMLLVEDIENRMTVILFGLQIKICDGIIFKHTICKIQRSYLWIFPEF